MNEGLLKEAFIKFISGVIILGLLLFVPAMSISWVNAWILMFLLFIPMLLGGIFMFIKAPNLLKNRLKSKETQNEQKNVIICSGIMFISSFFIAGLNYNFKWVELPKIFIIIGIVVFILSYIMFWEVLRENEYLSRTVEVQIGQKVVDTGLYGIVRHPMYLATVFLFLSMPLILGSPLSFLIMLVYIPIIVKRIENEEMVLEKELSGYKEYKEKVKYRIIPCIW
jgi:protein-S-isoprenylcysteine O-methyltransferase Ste14